MTEILRVGVAIGLVLMLLMLLYLLWSALAVSSAEEEKQQRLLAMHQMEGFTGVDISDDADETESE